MRTFKQARVVAGGAAVALVVTAPWLGSVEAAVPVQEVGWWTRSPIKPTVPEGGIAVGSAPDGPTSVGAAKVDLGTGGVTGATLSLPEAPSQVGGEVAALVVCTSASTWKPVAGGPITDAPKDECAAGMAALARQPDGTWTGAIDSLVNGKTGVVSLLVRPAPTAVAPFQLSFGPPAVGGELVVASSGGGTSAPTPSGGSSDGGTGSTPTPDTGSSSGGGSGSGGAPAAFDPPSSSSGEVALPAPAPSLAPPPQAEVPSGIGPVPQDAEETAFQPSGVVNTSSARKDVGRLTILSWFLLAAVVGAAAAGVSWANERGAFSPGGLKAAMASRRGASTSA